MENFHLFTAKKAHVQIQAQVKNGVLTFKGSIVEGREILLLSGNATTQLTCPSVTSVAFLFLAKTYTCITL